MTTTTDQYPLVLAHPDYRSVTVPIPAADSFTVGMSKVSGSGEPRRYWLSKRGDITFPELTLLAATWDSRRLFEFRTLEIKAILSWHTAEGAVTLNKDGAMELMVTLIGTQRANKPTPEDVDAVFIQAKVKLIAAIQSYFTDQRGDQTKRRIAISAEYIREQVSNEFESAYGYDGKIKDLQDKIAEMRRSRNESMITRMNSKEFRDNLLKDLGEWGELATVDAVINEASKINDRGVFVHPE